LKLAVVFPERQGRFQVSFGSVPDYAFAERGVRFEDIRAGSPAAKAGVKSGDILILWNGKEVENVEHWTGLLSSHKPGDVVPIRLKRGEASLDLEVKLEAR
jgi:S1-C subfamily serine protease